MNIRLTGLRQRNQRRIEGLFEESSAQRSNLSRRSVKGGTATLVAHLSRFVLQLVSTMVLARMLVPADFGLVAMVVALTNFARMFNTLGLSIATVQKKDITQELVSSLFWVNVALGISLTLIVAAVSPAIASFYGDPRLQSITMALSATFLLGGVSEQHRALLSRQMRFGVIGSIDVASALIGTVLGIGAAVLGAGYWSLVIMHVMIAFVFAVGMWVAVPWVPVGFKWTAEFREALGFGGHITGFNIVNYFSRNADNILIGKVFGADLLGFYSKAYSIMMLPVRELRGPVITVGLPPMSQLKDDPLRYRQYYLSLLKFLSFAAAPVTLFLGAYADSIVFVVLGPGWELSAQVFAILSISGAIQSVSGTAGLVLLSAGHGKRYFQIGVAMGLLTVGSFVAGLPWGIQGVAISYTVLNVVSLIPVLHLSFRDTAVSVKDFFRIVALPYTAAVIMLLGGRLVSSVFDPGAEWVFLVLSMSINIVFYLGSLALLPGGRRMLKDLMRHASNLIRRSENRPI